ncbi:thioredoxin [Bacillus thuringiensis]|uniref:thioredoxin family protein n=1 Tax=Bacillus cereus group TaxID=86661 RepID=UPI00137508A1|nr:MULTISPECIES: thioredoxin domain-containing protein [Bacillus cereus group]MBG9465135.1 thioredoxin [Bacillus thuringiensis]
MSIVHAVTKQELEEQLKTDKIVLINFWAEWCGPCKMFGVLLNQLNEECSDKVKIIRINVDKSPELSAEYQVLGIPHSRLIVNNQLHDPIVGFVSLEKLKKIIGV